MHRPHPQVGPEGFLRVTSGQDFAYGAASLDLYKGEVKQLMDWGTAGGGRAVPEEEELAVDAYLTSNQIIAFPSI